MVGKFSIIIKRISLQDITFCKVFGNNSKIVVSKNVECCFEILHVSRSVDYVQLRYRVNIAIKAVTRELAMLGITTANNQRWSRGHKARGQGQGHKKVSRPRTDPLEAKAKDADASVLKKKKKVLKIFFQASLLEKTKKRSFQIFRKVSGVFQRNFNDSKIVLSSSRGQGNFRGLEASRPRPRPRSSKCVLEAHDVLEDSISASNYKFLTWRWSILRS